MQYNPPFGQADLTNCERELIHLAGSVQPHGVLLVVDPGTRQILQATDNCAAVLGTPAQDLLGRPLARLGSALDATVARYAEGGAYDPLPLRCRIDSGASKAEAEAEGAVHRSADGVILVELEVLERAVGTAERVELANDELMTRLAATVERLSSAASIPLLADAVVSSVRELTGYDRVMVYKFDPDGHGKIIAEARHPRLEPLLGHHYPASDIPERARALYLRNRVRVLVDVHYQPSPLVPQRLPTTGRDLDMSMSALRSMSPLHLQYLKNMGVTATVVASLVREGRLWGLIACHHYAPRNLALPLRAAFGVLAEVASTRIAAIENYTYAQVALLVRRLEQRLIEATSNEGDWRSALLRNTRILLQPLEATGAVLHYGGEIMTAGEVPSTPELRGLIAWIGSQSFDDLFACSSVARANPALDTLTPTASGVLAVRLSAARPDYLLWLRKEQLQTVTWAGDPTKPALATDDPLQLSPRRSFAAWSEIVRGTALPWSGGELTLARAIGASLVDIILQEHAVRLLVGEHQMKQVKAAIDCSAQPALIADAELRVLFSNGAFARLLGGSRAPLASMEAASALFTEPQALRDALEYVRTHQAAWRGELYLVRNDRAPLPVRVRVDSVPAPQGPMLGVVLTVDDLSDAKRAHAARLQLEASLTTHVGIYERAPATDPVLRALVTNASVAAMDIADGAGTTAAAPLLEELEQATRRAASLYSDLQRLTRGD